MSQISFEIETELLNEAEKILDNYCLDIVTVSRIMLKRIVREQSIDFLIWSKSQKIQSDTELSASNQGSQKFTENQPNSHFPHSFQQDRLVDSPPHLKYLEYKPDKGNMTRNLARHRFVRDGFKIADNLTFASKNRSANNYWANPLFSFLNSDWSLILNNWIDRKLYLFFIPANSIKSFQLRARSDQKDLIDLQITFRDPTFTDNRSNFSFAEFFVGELDY